MGVIKAVRNSVAADGEVAALWVDSSAGRIEIHGWCYLYGRWPDNQSRQRLYHIKIYKEKTSKILW
jgi:hypothetical protein